MWQWARRGGKYARLQYRKCLLQPLTSHRSKEKELNLCLSDCLASRCGAARVCPLVVFVLLCVQLSACLTVIAFPSCWCVWRRKQRPVCAIPVRSFGHVHTWRGRGSRYPYQGSYRPRWWPCTFLSLYSTFAAARWQLCQENRLLLRIDVQWVKFLPKAVPSDLVVVSNADDVDKHKTTLTAHVRIML